MEARNSPLHMLLDCSVQYCVPLYQRGYAWKQASWKTLFNDALNLCFNKDKPSHFLGAIVLIREQELSSSMPPYLLIDGQQRMVSLLLLLAAVRDSSQDSLREKIQDRYLHNRYPDAPEQRSKLVPSQLDYRAFADIILQENEPDSNAAVTQAYNYFKSALAEQVQKGLSLNSFMEAIVARFELVRIELSQSEDPYAVFESLNSTGQKLTAADLVRNHLFMRIADRSREDQQRLYNEYWLPIERNLQGDELSLFIWRFLMKDGHIVLEPETFATFRKSMKNKEPSEYLKELSRYADYFYEITRYKSGSAKLNKLFRSLNAFGNVIILPLTLNLYNLYKTQRLNESQLSACLAKLENFLGRRWACHTPTAGLNKSLMPLCSLLSSQKWEADGLAQAFEKKLASQSYPNNTQLQEKIPARSSFYAPAINLRTKMLLYKIEEAQNSKESLEWEKLTIEHIMPQKLNDAWKASLGGDFERIHAKYINSLGNLTLSGSNSELSNKSFEEKREILKESRLRLNSALSETALWNEQAIAQRTQSLIQTIIKMWPEFAGAEQAASAPPQKLEFLGYTVSLNSYKDLLENTINILQKEAEPEQWQAAADALSVCIDTNPDRWTKSQRLDNGMYLDPNLNAARLHEYCLTALEAAGIGEEEWQVSYKEASPS